MLWLLTSPVRYILWQAALNRIHARAVLVHERDGFVHRDRPVCPRGRPDVSTSPITRDPVMVTERVFDCIPAQSAEAMTASRDRPEARPTYSPL